MKKFLSLLCALLFISNAWSKDCKITYENEGFLMVVMNTSFQAIEYGSTVPEGTNILIALSCNNGYSLESFLINDVEHKDKLADYDQEGRNFQYSYTVTEDTHIKAISKVMTFPAIFSTTGNGTLKLYVGSHLLQSGDMIEYGSDLTIKAEPDENNKIEEFRINGEDYLGLLLNSNNSLTRKVYDKTTVEAVFTGNGRETDNSYPVTWTVTGKGNLMVKCGSDFLASGDKVIKGDYIDIWIIPEEGNSLLSLKINGEEYDKELTGKLRLQVLEALDIEAEFGKTPERKVWTELAADSYAGGNGTEENPYQIATAEQFAKMAKDMLEGDTDFTDTYFELTADISLKGNDWYPIGFNSMSNGEKSFNGKVNGNGFSIKGLEIKPIDDHSSAGLFGSTGVGFELRNLTIESGTVIGNMITGAFAGFNRGLIENCVNKAKVACNQFYCGGIAGSNSKVSDDTPAATIRSCSNYGTVVAGNGNANGIAAAGIAASTSSVIEECANWGEIVAPTSSAGGITAVMEGGIIRHCFNRGYIRSSEQVAGIAASALGRSGNCEIFNCYSASTLNATTQGSIGAIIGIALFQNKNTLTVCDSYYDTSLYGGNGYGTAEDIFGNFNIENLTGMNTATMKSADFIDRLNSETQGAEKWAEDNRDVNQGYPVFTFMASANTVHAEKEMNVYAAEGHIRIEGADCNSTAEVFTTTGTKLFSGNCERLYSKTFAPGLYLLRVCGQTYKVVVR